MVLKKSLLSVSKDTTNVLGLTFLGSYTVQIWWKGDPGVENFVIKFTNEEMMRKWATGLDTQRKENTPTATASPEQAAPDFTWMRNVNNIENPYAQQDDEDEEEDEDDEDENVKCHFIIQNFYY